MDRAVTEPPAVQAGPPRAFRDFKFATADFAPLHRRASVARLKPQGWWPLFDTLSRRPAGDFPSFRSAFGERAGQLRRVARDSFLAGVDARLQALYRQHLERAGIPPGLTQDERLALFAEIEPQAHAIVDEYDWSWLSEWLGGVETERTCRLSLSNLAHPCGHVTFRFTRHCNITCAHCYNESGPRLKQQRIAREDMLATIRDMPAAGIPAINLTGGEPFLYQDDLIAMTQAARAAGLEKVGINTNGFFAGSERSAAGVLERLAKAGFGRSKLDRIKASTGVYHQPFLAVERIANLARAYHRVFARPLIVDWELAPGQEEEGQRLAGASLDPASLGAPVIVRFRRVAPLGRARDIPAVRHGVPDQVCSGINQLVFEADQKVRPCCGMNFENEGIVQANTAPHNLKRIVKAMQNDGILQFLATRPMRDLLAVTGKTDRPGGYGGLCDGCQHVLGDLTGREALLEALFPQQRYYPFWFA